MSKKQITILICFNIVALIGILVSAFLLGTDVNEFFMNPRTFAGGGTNLFRWWGYFQGYTITIHNYLFVVSLATVITNIILIISFSVRNKRRK